MNKLMRIWSCLTVIAVWLSVQAGLPVKANVIPKVQTSINQSQKKFLLFNANETGNQLETKIAAHYSHRSHGSHRSHYSHYSSRY